MSVTLLDQTPPTLHRKLGPYRRADYAVLPDETRCELIFGRPTAPEIELDSDALWTAVAREFGPRSGP